ncbi:alpha/beta fold hydrolase [Achromobacter sp. JUb104]|uniref:alpha/beta fold hydrolase n=1 Tax=Achromobacter sp. JUb104 TaxID=2940590 RepID=UPI002167C44B|nr:alpha/beta fold hydrolase [Achromobacter sp. JUb104]MCS3508224.1 pimeloyl-ACP methyl ester carboxylesterase [Achromobacter sp. JUb104]
MPVGQAMTQAQVQVQPVTLADFGSFYAGGRPVNITGLPQREIAFTKSASLAYDPNGLYHFEQAYVQYFIPAQLVHPLPIVLLHGGGMTGAMWEQTPDGRAGWMQHFLRQGHAVYVVDNVERGRAGWAPFEQVWPEQPIIRNAQESWSLFRLGRAEDFDARHAFAGQRFPVSAFDDFIRHAVPRWLGNNDAALQGFCAVLDRVGPCLVVAHSHGGEVAYRALHARPDLVRGVIGIEPSGFSGDVAAAAVADKPFLFVYGDYLDATPLWQRLCISGRDYADTLARHGARVDTWRLAEMGIAGNSHMPMMDDNSDDIAARIGTWIRAASV